MNINEGKERNALAELADALKANASYLNGEGLDCARDNVLLASRIIAYLAKVDATYVADMVHNNICLLAYDAFEKCREIAAEEGAY